MPFFLSGVAIGVGAFGILMAALLPVLWHKRKASMARGYAAILVSFTLLHLGVIAVYLFWREYVLAHLLGELVGFFVCWACLAVYCMRSRRR